MWLRTQPACGSVTAMTNTVKETPAAAKYREIIVPNMTHADLLDALLFSARQNSYGSHNEQIRIERAEILRRMTHYR